MAGPGEKRRSSPEGDYPPEWIEQSKRDGTPITMWATSSPGAVYLAVWRQFRDATSFEQGLAGTPLSGYSPIRLPFPEEGVARVKAVRRARTNRPDLSDDRWAWVLSFVWPTLSDEARKDHQAILAAVEALAPSPRATVAEARGLTVPLIRLAAQRVRRRTDRAPTQALVAEELGTSVATLKRAIEDLGMGRWPPAPPERMS
jgi:hypothetical protein